MLGRLTDAWEDSQPPYLRHLAIVRDTHLENKTLHYIYRSYENFNKAVAAGEAAWDVNQEQKQMIKKRKNTKPFAQKWPTEFDQWGFPHIPATCFVHSNGAATLSECAYSIAAKPKKPTSRDFRISELEQQSVEFCWDSGVRPPDDHPEQMPQQGDMTADKRMKRPVGRPKKISSVKEAVVATNNPKDKRLAAEVKRYAAQLRKVAYQIAWKEVIAQQGAGLGKNDDAAPVAEQPDVLATPIAPTINNASIDTPDALRVEDGPTQTPTQDSTTNDDLTGGATQSGPESKSAPSERGYEMVDLMATPLSQHSQQQQENGSHATVIPEVQVDQPASSPLLKLKGGQPGKAAKKRKKPDQTSQKVHVPEERIQELISELAEMKRPGVYINPVGSIRKAARGRPKKQLNIVIKHDRLVEFEWFKNSAPDGAAADDVGASFVPQLIQHAAAFRGPSVVIDAHSPTPVQDASAEVTTVPIASDFPTQTLIGDQHSEDPRSVSVVEHQPTNEEQTLPPNAELAAFTPFDKEACCEDGDLLRAAAYSLLAATDCGDTQKPTSLAEQSDENPAANPGDDTGPPPHEISTANQMADSPASHQDAEESNGSLALAKDAPVPTSDPVMEHAEVTAPAFAGEQDSYVACDDQDSLREDPLAIPRAHTDQRLEQEKLDSVETLATSEPLTVEAQPHAKLPQFLENDQETGQDLQTQEAIGEGASQNAEHPKRTKRVPKKQGVLRGRGTIYHMRSKLLFDLISVCGGVFPGGRAIYRPFATVWAKRNDGVKPDHGTISRALKGIIDSGKVRKVTFTFKTKEGITVTSSVCTLTHILPDSQLVRAMQTQIMNAYPHSFIPPQVKDLLPQRSQRTRVHGFSKETGTTWDENFKPSYLTRLEQRIAESEKKRQSAKRAAGEGGENDSGSELRDQDPARARGLDNDAPAPRKTRGGVTRLARLQPRKKQAASDDSLENEIEGDHLTTGDPTAGSVQKDNMETLPSSKPSRLPPAIDQESEAAGFSEQSECYEELRQPLQFSRPPPPLEITFHHFPPRKRAVDEHPTASPAPKRRKKTKADKVTPIHTAPIAKGIHGPADPNYAQDYVIFVNTSPSDFNPTYELQRIETLLTPDQRFYPSNGTFSTEFSVFKSARQSLWVNARLLDTFEEAMPKSLADILDVPIPGRKPSYHTWVDHDVAHFDKVVNGIQAWERYFDKSGHYEGLCLSQVRFINISSPPITVNDHALHSSRLRWDDQKSEHYTLKEHPYLVRNDRPGLTSARPAKRIATEATSYPSKAWEVPLWYQAPVPTQSPTMHGNTPSLLPTSTSWVPFSADASSTHPERLARHPALTDGAPIHDASGAVRPSYHNRLLPSPVDQAFDAAAAVMGKAVHGSQAMSPPKPSTADANRVALPKRRGKSKGGQKSADINRGAVAVPARPNARKRKRTSKLAPGEDEDSTMPSVASSTPPAKRSTNLIRSQNIAIDHSKFRPVPDRLLMAIIVTRTLVGGTDQNINWNFVLEAFRAYPAYDPEVLKSCWKLLRLKHAWDIERMQEQFEEIFLTSYEQGHLPRIDYEKLDSYNWNGLVDWALERIKVTERIEPTSTPEVIAPKLPANRAAFDAGFDVKKVSKFVASKEHFFSVLTVQGRREDLMFEFDYHVPSQSMPYESSTVDTLTMAHSWVRANIVTPGSSYDAVAARTKLDRLGEGLAAKALTALLKTKSLRTSNNSRTETGRKYELADSYLSPFRRQIDMPMLRTAAAYKKMLDDNFRSQATLEGASGELAGGNSHGIFLDPCASNGVILAATNLLAGGRINAVPRVPPIDVNAIRDDTKPLRISKWGFTVGAYQKGCANTLHRDFPIEIQPSTDYVFGNPLLLRSHPVPPPCTAKPGPFSPSTTTDKVSDGELELIPLWIDIHGNFLPEWWERIIGGLVAIIAARPAIGIEGIFTLLKGALERWELELAIEWLRKVEAVAWCDEATDMGLETRKPRSGRGLTTREWWWMVLADPNGPS